MSPEPPVIDPYEVLGLERTATSEEVKKAYRKASLRTHPGMSSLARTTMAEKHSRHVPFPYICY